LFFYLHLRRAFKRVLKAWGRPDVIHTQDSYSYFVMRALSSFHVPFVISQHWNGFMEGLIGQRALRQFRWAFSQAVRVLSVNRFSEKDYAGYGLYPATTWLPNAVDTGIFAPDPNVPKESWLLHASGLTKEKRLPDIIRAFALVRRDRPDAVLQIAGDGPNRAEMEALAMSMLPPASYHFHGMLSKPELAEFMRRSCGFILTSDSETFGCVLIEAMASGCPVLTTAVGGIPAVVRKGEGLIVEVGNITQIADGMRQLLDGKHGVDLDRVSQDARSRFSHETVGRILHQEHERAATVGQECRDHREMSLGSRSVRCIT
jgi:glycosyltransferase involved in cell wall biosynthesis